MRGFAASAARRAGLALMVMLAAAGAFAQQGDLTLRTALQNAIGDHLVQVRGNRLWPYAGPPTAPRPGAEAADFAARNSEAMRNSDVLAISGAITGPGGFSQAINSTGPAVLGSRPITLAGRGLGEVRVIQTNGMLDIIAGVATAEGAWAASRSGAATGELVSIQIGGGWALRLTPTWRDPDERERMQMGVLAEQIATTYFREDGTMANTPPATGAPVFQSPLTNSVIREGDPRAPGATKD